jgi:hypothetical protein
MNKKTIIVWSLIAAGVIAVIGLLLYFLSFRTVTFTIVPDNLSVTIYNQESQEVGKLQQDGSLRLQDGTYAVAPEGNMFSNTAIPFTVEGQNMTVSIDPGYSDDHLKTLLQTEQAAITKVIKDAYSTVIGDFTVAPGKLYEKGEWYAGLVVQNPLGGGQFGDVYRTVLKKENDAWVVKADPSIVLSSSDYPDIPRAILSDSNAQERP